MNQQLISTQKATPSSAPIDTQQIVKYGESPTAIILAIAILISILLGSITGLVQVIMMSKMSR